jgi:hypothetical protein
MLLNAYLIFLICTQGSIIKRTVQSGGATPNGKIPFPFMTKRERFIKCRGKRHDSRGRNGHKDAEDRGMVLGGTRVL